MFQNISEELNEDIQTSEDTQKQHIFKEMFKIQNIIFYIITLMASAIGFGQAIYPFGIALFAASCSNQIPALIPFILGAVGTFIGFGATGLITYLLMALIFIALVMFTKPKIADDQINEKQKLGKHLLFSCFIVQTIKLIIGSFLVYNLLEAIAFSIAAYIFYKIFTNSITVIKEFGIKKAFSAEEVLGASLLIAIAVTSINQITIFNFSVTNIICILLVLILGWKNGVLIGAASGVTIGVVTGIIANSEPVLLATYALSRTNCRSIK